MKFSARMKIAHLSFFFLLMTSAQAGALDVIATLTPGGSAQDIDTVIRLARGTDIRSVFSPTETEMLVSIGRSSLASARKFAISGESGMTELSRQIAKRRLPVAIERAEIKFQLYGPEPMQSNEDARAIPGASFEMLQWGNHNSGQTVPIAIDDLTSEPVVGKPGEDIGVDRAPKEMMDVKHQIKIAVLDTGIDFANSELTDRTVENTRECYAVAAFAKCKREAKALKLFDEQEKAADACDTKYAGKDNDGNGYPLDCSGWNVTKKPLETDLVWGDADARDLVGHGTHVSGTIGARSDDGTGVRGVMDNVRIIPVKVITAPPTSPVRLKEVANPREQRNEVNLKGVPLPTEKKFLQEQDGLGDLIARGLLYAIRSGAQIVNMSLGWPAHVDSNLMKEMIDLARSRGILLVAAAGNDGTDAIIRPCVFEGVICVAAHDPDGAISHFSNFGPGVDIAAPGLNILSTFPTTIRPPVFADRNGYELKSGTSMATPYIAGLLGRLLNAGYSPKEATARLFAGTRKSIPNSRVNRDRDLIVQTGNADLGLAFKANRQPLIFPISKKPIIVPWDRKQRGMPISLNLENTWADAKEVSISIALVGASSIDGRLLPNRVSASNWKSGERKSFNLDLGILSDRIDSELMIKLSINATDAKTGATYETTRYNAIEIVAIPNSNDSEIETISLKGNAVQLSALRKSELTSIRSDDGRPQQDYLAIQSNPESQKISLITQNSDSFGFRGSVTLPPPPGDLQLIQRIDINNDGDSDYVLIWMIKPTKELNSPALLLRFFDSNFRPLAQQFDGRSATEFTFRFEESFMTDSFQWITVGGRKVPAWISRGTTPLKEKPKYDPWNPNPIDFPDFRLYYVGDNGLSTLTKKLTIPVAFFPASREEMKTGARRMLWMTGEGTEANYEVTSIIDLKPTEPVAAGFTGYRRLRSTMMAPLLNLAGTGQPLAGETVGVGFFSDSYQSAIRISGIISEPGGGKSLFDRVSTPPAKIDAVTSVIGAYAGPQTSASIVQTIYEMQFEDVRSGEKATASLKRFSFLPDAFFEKLYRPVIGDDRQNAAERLPMVYLAQWFGTVAALEVITPRYEAGRLRGFIRPARLHLAAPSGCQPLEDPVDATATQPTRLVFACGNKFMFVPLKY